jgi:hypothetical protein
VRVLTVNPGSASVKLGMERRRTQAAVLATELREGGHRRDDE